MDMPMRKALKQALWKRYPRSTVPLRLEMKPPSRKNDISEYVLAPEAEISSPPPGRFLDAGPEADCVKFLSSSFVFSSFKESENLLSWQAGTQILIGTKIAGSPYCQPCEEISAPAADK